LCFGVKSVKLSVERKIILFTELEREVQDEYVVFLKKSGKSVGKLMIAKQKSTISERVIA
jgi:hypothetical protein